MTDVYFCLALYTFLVFTLGWVMGRNHLKRGIQRHLSQLEKEAENNGN